ncbi:MAG: SDR family NAD(P)-dependent oxidoreductase, partial [Spirochaetales bacterium]|nr:SDR family NAD(P)-dependent oxidoreductase [Spirochaetales bacterium]
MEQKIDKGYSPKDIDKCISILTHLIDNSDEFAALSKEQQIELMKTAGQLSRPDRYQLIKRNKAIRKKHRQQIVSLERKARAATGIRLAREDAVFTAPLQLPDNTESGEGHLILQSPRNCYVCKAEFTKLHFFYDSMCPDCAELNYQKRFQTANLKGQVALITGSRLKIGYQATLMMLRSGATVIATTRFPVDSALRYSKENDFHEWEDRLHIYGLDLRHTPSVELFCSHIEQTFDRLDILINNAAQTVRRPPEFYAHLIENESKEIAELPSAARKLMMNYQICTNKLNSFVIPQVESESTLPVSWYGKLPGIGLRESAQLSQIPYA